jgi:hypothetical protein
MNCKYCGQNVKKSGNLLMATSGGSTCAAAPGKRHVLVPDGVHCVYCGGETISKGVSLLVDSNPSCPYSPSGKHQLAE